MLDMANGYSELYNTENINLALKFGYDKQKQLYWLEKAADAGDSDGLLELGDFYRFEENEKAIDCYKRALEVSTQNRDYKCYLEACKELESIYMYKVIIKENEEDLTNAEIYCKKIIEKGIPSREEVATFHPFYMEAVSTIGAIYYRRYRKNALAKDGRIAAYANALCYYKDVDNTYQDNMKNNLRELQDLYSDDDLNIWKEHAYAYAFRPETL